LDAAKLGVHQHPKGVWNPTHEGVKSNVEGKFRAYSLVPKTGESILVRMDFEGATIAQSTLVQVPLSNLHARASEAIKQYTGHGNLSQEQRAAKHELEGILDREKSQEHQQTVEVIHASCSGVEVSIPSTSKGSWRTRRRLLRASN